MKVNLSGRSMPRVLVKGEVVRAEVLPRQWAHQDPPQGREGAAGNLSVHFAGSHIIGTLIPSTSTYVIQMETTSNPRPTWCLRRYILTTLFGRVPERKARLSRRDTRVVSAKRETASFIRLPIQLQVIIRFRLRSINVALRFNEIIRITRMIK